MFINESCIRFPFHFYQRFRLKTEGNDQDDELFFLYTKIRIPHTLLQVLVYPHPH